MEIAHSSPLDSAVKPRRKHRAKKSKLLTRDGLDKRTRAHRQFDQIAAGIVSDLGGKDRLSTIEQALVEAFSGAALHVFNLNARLLLGEQIDLSDHAHAVSSLVRVAARLGCGRRPRDVTPTLAAYLQSTADAADDLDAADEGALLADLEQHRG